MNQATDPDASLFAEYGAAVLTFNTASASLILHLAAKSVPTNAEITAEENARAAVVAARRKLWAVYEKRSRQTSV